MKKLYILEGPDGSGKTTFGNKISEKLGIPITNHGPYKGESEIWRHYFDSMLPAYANERGAILDRCWLAEPIYGKVFRNGMNRLVSWQLKLLEHVASECQAVVIWCMPPLERCIATFNSRRSEEYLDNDTQLRQVYELYEKEFARQLSRDLPNISHMVYDYTSSASKRDVEGALL